MFFSFVMMKEQEKVKKDIYKLLAEAKAGNTEAFGFLYKEYYTPVFRYAYLRVGERTEAEDITQTTFLKVFEKGTPIENIGKDPLAYFFTVARNSIIDHSRKKKEMRFSDFEEGFSETVSVASAHEHILATQMNIETVLKVTEELSDDQREVITLRFFGERTTKEIAKLLGKSEEAIRQIQSRALKILSKKLQNKMSR